MLRELWLADVMRWQLIWREQLLVNERAGRAP
jgi:hypothetical protein